MSIETIQEHNLHPQHEQAPILLAMQQNKVEESIRAYLELKTQRGVDDFDVVRQMASLLLHSGFYQNDPEVQLLSLFGAGLAQDSNFLNLFSLGITSQNPQLQLASAHFLARSSDDKADTLLNKAMSSPYLLIRLETAFSMAQKRSPLAASQIEALMYKVDPALKPFFPRLLALEGSHRSLAIMRQLLTDTNKDVRIECLLNAAECGRDDLLPEIRLASLLLDGAEQEAAAFALGVFKDESSANQLMKLAQSRQVPVKCAASFALMRLGRQEALQSIVDLAKNDHDLFAINLLGEFPGNEDLLAEIMESSDMQIKSNAAIALINLRDPRGLDGLYPLLIKDASDLALQEVFSSGRALKAWRVVPSARQQFKDNPIAYERSNLLREQLLQKTIDLPKDAFLHVAETLLTYRVRDLIPLLVDLLENAPSPEAVSLLKRHLEQPGAPLIRAYCNLALYRLKENGPYAKRVAEWVLSQKEVELIRFRPLMPWKEKISSPSPYVLTPLEQSRLLIDSLIALASQKDPDAIEVILELIAKGNPKNRPALAGLLIRAVE